MALMHFEPSYQAPLQGFGSYGRRLPVLELLVPMCCTKCQEKVRENMLELQGVQAVVADLTTQRVIVHGFVDPMKALKKAKKVKRDSQIWTCEAPPMETYYHLPSKYRRSEHQPRRLPMSSVYRASSLERHHRMAPVYRASYNQFTPSYETQSFIHHPPVVQPVFESGYIHHDPYSHVIANPLYVKHVEPDYY